MLIKHDDSEFDNKIVLKMLQEVIGLVFSETEFYRLVDDLHSIDYSRTQLMLKPSITLSNIFTKTERGAMFIKHCLKSKSRKQWFLLKDDRLYWKNTENGLNRLNRSIEMKSIVRIRPGKQTKTFKSRQLKKICKDCCFSLIGVRKTLDLECKSRKMRDEWFIYIEFIYRKYVPLKCSRALSGYDELDDLELDCID
eukprot:198647_1